MDAAEQSFRIMILIANERQVRLIEASEYESFALRQLRSYLKEP